MTELLGVMKRTRSNDELVKLASATASSS
jgi:hypothetical protein